VFLLRETPIPQAAPTGRAGRPGNHAPVAQKPDADVRAWVESVAALPAEGQVRPLAAKLQERNPGFDGQVKHTIHNGAVQELEFVSRSGDRPRPGARPARLQRLGCAGSGPGLGRVADLAPLAGLALAVLDCSATRWLT